MLLLFSDRRHGLGASDVLDWTVQGAVALAIAGCAMIDTDRVPVNRPPVRIALQGYSLVPPDGPGWVRTLKASQRIVFEKPGSNPDDLRWVSAGYVKGESAPPSSSEEWAAAYRRTMEANTNVLRGNVAPYPMEGAECIKAYWLRANPVRPMKTSDSRRVLEENSSLLCAHPANTKITLVVSYMHWRYPEDSDPRFRGEAEAVLKSVRINQP